MRGFTKVDIKSEEKYPFCVYALIKEANKWNG